MQLNHPGRQMPAALKQDTIAPSEVSMNLGGFSRQFVPPRVMTEADIAEVKARFVKASVLAEATGFTGVQIHAAHGYLLSQFLSPLTNKRTDRWGGSLDNRARLLIEIVKEVRAAVGAKFAVSVKLNSADFQRGGFIAAVARMPVMVTGGIRRLPVAEQVLASGIDMVGMATALAIEPNLPKAWRHGTEAAPVLRPITWRNKVLASVGYMAMVKHQLRRLSLGRRTRPDVAPALALVEQQVDTLVRTWRYRRWVKGLAS